MKINESKLNKIISESIKKVLKENEGDFTKYYMLLSRLQQDCNYYLGHGGRDAKHSLWAHDEQGQIDKMRELYDMLPVKPEWITPEDIDNYAKEMGVYSNTDVNESVNKIVNESKEQNEVVLQSVDTEYFKTSKTGNPIYKVCGETLEGEEFCGYTTPNASCAYVCRGLSSEHLRRKQQYLKITYHFTPKGIKSIDFMDFIDKY